jgi:hypothetical protein
MWLASGTPLAAQQFDPDAVKTRCGDPLEVVSTKIEGTLKARFGELKGAIAPQQVAPLAGGYLLQTYIDDFICRSEDFPQVRDVAASLQGEVFEALLNVESYLLDEDLDRAGMVEAVKKHLSATRANYSDARPTPSAGAETVNAVLPAPPDLMRNSVQVGLSTAGVEAGVEVSPVALETMTGVVFGQMRAVSQQFRLLASGASSPRLAISRMIQGIYLVGLK